MAIAETYEFIDNIELIKPQIPIGTYVYSKLRFVIDEIYGIPIKTELFSFHLFLRDLSSQSRRIF